MCAIWNFLIMIAFYKEIPYHLERPISNVKRHLRELTTKQWQLEWNYGNMGRMTHEFFPNVDSRRIMSWNLRSQIYTGHGAFLDYLNRFTSKDEPNCSFVELRTPKRYLTSYTLTQSLDMIHITPNSKNLWYNQLANNKHVQRKRRAVVRWSLEKNRHDITLINSSKQWDSR